MNASVTTLITGIIAVYNGDKYITKALLSLVNQSTSIDSIIVIDDGSTDNTLNICQELAKIHSSIELLTNDINMGVSFSRNKACANAHSEWLLFLDADDLVEPSLVEKLHQQIRASSAVLYYSAYQQIDALDNPISSAMRFKNVASDEILGYEFVRNQVSLSGALVSAKAFNQCGGFDVSLSFCEDWDLWIKLARNGGFIYIDDVLVSVRRHQSNVSGNVVNFEAAAKQVLNQYSLDYIEQAINKRTLPDVSNKTDFVSILFFLEYWQKGFKLLNILNDSNPDNNAVHFYLAIYYCHKQQYETAEIHFGLATTLNDNDAASWNNLGVCRAMAGAKQDSLWCFEKALSFHDNYIDALFNLNKLSNKQNKESFKISWKQLREVLLNYQNML